MYALLISPTSTCLPSFVPYTAYILFMSSAWDYRFLIEYDPLILVYSYVLQCVNLRWASVHSQFLALFLQLLLNVLLVRQN